MSATATPSDADLWPDDLEPKGEPSPASILRQQGYRLGARTEQVVYGEVESRYTDGKFTHTMYLSAPYLKLRQPIVVVEHDIPNYPANAALTFADGRRAVQVGDRRSAVDLKHTLRDFFKSPDVVLLIQSLLAQARDLDDEAEAA